MKRGDKTEANQSAGLSRRTEIGHRRNRGITAGATAVKPQKHQAVQSAVPDFDGLELGNEVKAETHDVRRDRTKVNESVSLSGTIEVEHQAAGQVAGSQTRPESPVPAVAGLDAGWAVKTAKKEAALAGVKAACLSGTMEIERLSYAADRCGNPGSTQKPPETQRRHRERDRGEAGGASGDRASGRKSNSTQKPRSKEVGGSLGRCN